MFVSGFVYVSRYALVNPFVDEWEFMPVLFGDEPALPWLWALHNEHRFPLPRILYLELFWLSGDLRTGCYISLLGIGLCALGLMYLARRVRGRSSIADAVFPLLLMHTGQGENLYMGYQMCFMLTTVLAAALLAVLVQCGMRLRVLPHDAERRATPSGPASRDAERRATLLLRHAMIAVALGWLLLTCGAAGLCYGVAAATWVIFLAFAGRMEWWRRGLLLASAAMTPIYIVLYLHGYHRPSHHPPSAGVVESIRIGLEAQAMAFGPAATGMWPFIGIGIIIAAIWVGVLLGQRLVRNPRNPATIGLALVVAAGAAVAFGIGWGRSGFHRDMGMAWRYGWLTFPPIAAGYFTWLLRGGRVSIYAPMALLALMLILAPVNCISGFLDAETNLRRNEDIWEADVRSGLTADQLIAKHYPDYPPASRDQMAAIVRLMRDHHYAYYDALGREEP